MSTSADLARVSVADLGALLQARDVSPVEVVEACIARTDAVEPHVAAYVTRTSEQALAQAKAAEAEIAAGNYRGPLHGIPYGTKDIYWTKGIRTTSGSAVDADFVPDRDARAVELMNEAGAISLGKTHTTEYAFDPTGRNDTFGPPHNPWKHGHYTGGSSSGSAAAIAAGSVPFALGSDTGGSIRIPCSWSGITGIKPTFGLVSRARVTPLSWTLDTAGPMARNARDVALVLNALAGFDPDDPGSMRHRREDYTQGIDDGVAGLRIGVPRAFLAEHAIDPEVRAAFDAALTVFERLEASLEDVDIPELHYGELGSFIITAEAAELHRERIRAHAGKYDQRTRRRIESGYFISGRDYMYAQRVRTLLGRALTEAFRHIDLLVMPTTIAPAAAHGVLERDIGGRRLLTRESALMFTRVFNQNGLPATSTPCGFSADGLPLGLMLVGRAFADGLVLRATATYERETGWAGRIAEVG